MPNEFAIQGLYLTGMPSTPSAWVGQTVAGQANYATFDFFDTALNDDFLSPNTADRIRHNGTLYPVSKILVLGVTIIDKWGKHYSFTGVPGGNATGFRAYDLGGGKFILRPLDSALAVLPDYKSWVSIHFDSATTVTATRMSLQDAPFPLCFVAGTRIMTASGEQPVESLRPGDLVMTRDHGPKPLTWVGRSVCTAEQARLAPQFAPVAISAGALGRGLPATTLRVSPQHRILLRNPSVAALFGAGEVLCPAKALVGRPGINRESPEGDTVYFHLLFDRHEVLMANGAEAESFFPGRQALAALDPEALEELDALFPALDLPLTDRYQPARPFVRGPKIARLLMRTGSAALAEPAPAAPLAAAG